MALEQVPVPAVIKYDGKDFEEVINHSYIVALN